MIDPFADTLGVFVPPPPPPLSTVNGHKVTTATSAQACIAGRDYQPNVGTTRLSPITTFKAEA